LRTHLAVGVPLSGPAVWSRHAAALVFCGVPYGVGSQPGCDDRSAPLLGRG